MMQNIDDGGLGQDGDLRAAVYEVYGLSPLLVRLPDVKPTTDEGWKAYQEEFLRTVVDVNRARFAETARLIEERALQSTPDTSMHDAIMMQVPRLYQRYIAEERQPLHNVQSCC